MMIIGVDSHPGFPQIAFFVEETGACGEQELSHRVMDWPSSLTESRAHSLTRPWPWNCIRRSFLRAVRGLE